MLLTLTIEIPDSDSDDERIKRAIKKAIKIIVRPKRRWILNKTVLGPKWLKWSTTPWDYDSRYLRRHGSDILVSELERMLGYSSVENYNSYLIEGSEYVWKYRKTRISTILKHLKTDIGSMKIVIEE